MQNPELVCYMFKLHDSLHSGDPFKQRWTKPTHEEKWRFIYQNIEDDYLIGIWIGPKQRWGLANWCARVEILQELSLDEVD